MINVVLFSIHSFWGAVFILPLSVLKKADRKCRDYLWGCSEEKRNVSLVAWEKVCFPKKCGGLNIKGCVNRNMASAGKLLWQLTENKASLWVKEVHHGIYMKTDSNIFFLKKVT